MSSSHLRKLKLASAALAIAAAGALAGFFAQNQRRGEMLEALTDDARRAAAAFDPAEIRALKGTRDDLSTTRYLAFKQRLRRLRAANADVRYVYVFRAERSGGRPPEVIFLGDSASAGARDESLPGDRYPEASSAYGLQKLLRDGQPATEGPLTDSFGTWMTAYAPIGESSGPTAHVVGMDVDAAEWKHELWQAAFQGAFYVWVLLGLPIGAFVIRRQQDEQRDAIRNLSEAMEQSHSAILIVDLDTRIEYANRGLCALFGVTRRDLLGHKWREGQIMRDAELLDEILATVRAGRSWEGEWQAPRKEGGAFPVRAVVTPVRRRSGAVSCYVAVIDDITETKRRETELREARDLAEAGDRAKGQFLATMSHEVRTPLNGIVGFTSLLLETPINSEQREYVQTIKMSTEALIQLTGDILDFARIESGKLKLEALACDPRECVEDALDLLAQKAADKGVELLHDVPETVPAAVVVDGGRLRQVLINLVGNAVKFTERGEIEVSVSAEIIKPAAGAETPAPVTAQAGDLPATGAPRETCVLTFTVRDTGIGIAPVHQARLFKPFTQVDETTTRRYGGTGLGLAISRDLVGLMGGEINFVSEVGRGSTFRFTIRAPVAAEVRPPRDLGGLPIGVVATSEPLERELKRCLGRWGAAVKSVPTPEDLEGAGCQLGMVEISDTFARELAVRTEPLEGLPPEKMIGLVAINLSNELRTALRAHFRLLVNKPLHHDGLFSLLAGARSEAPATVARTRFGFRVLVVEDNAVNQHLVRRVLTGLGCISHTVGNGRLALDELAARADQFDLVLLDFHMPEMDGMAALEEIRSGRAGARAQTMWIIALTADAREDQRARATGAGINDYLTKPVRIEDVETALKRFRVERGSRRR